jgi:hemerythrin-like domain-containing protein
MKATEQLKKEHKAIKAMLDILRQICRRIQAGQKPDQEHLEQVVEFTQVFADKCHHSKEEEVLFRAMENAGVHKEDGPIGVMLLEHKKAREYVQGMVEGVAAHKTGDPDAASKIVENANAYIRTLHAHIDKEDGVLYPMADARLSSQQQEHVTSTCQGAVVCKYCPEFQKRPLSLSQCERDDS